MPEPVKMAFERQVVVLPLSNILPMKRVFDTVKQAMRYKRIVASIGEVGIVEPLGRSRHRRYAVHCKESRAGRVHCLSRRSITNYTHCWLGRTRPSNAMLGSGPTTPQDYLEKSGFAPRRERECGHRRQWAGANRRPHPCASTSLAMTESPCAASRRP